LRLFFEDDLNLTGAILEGASIADFERGLISIRRSFGGLGTDALLYLVGIDAGGRIRVFPLTFPNDGMGTARAYAADARLITPPQPAVAIARTRTVFKSQNDGVVATNTAVVFFADGSAAEITPAVIANPESMTIEPLPGLSGRIMDVGIVKSFTGSGYYGHELAVVTDESILFTISISHVPSLWSKGRWRRVAHSDGPSFASAALPPSRKAG
jgi:hypothetical protein